MKKNVSILLVIMTFLVCVFTSCSNSYDYITPESLNTVFTANIELKNCNEGEVKFSFTRNSSKNWSLVYKIPESLSGISVSAKGGKYETCFLNLLRTSDSMPFSETSSIRKLIDILNSSSQAREYTKEITENTVIFRISSQSQGEYSIYADANQGTIKEIECEAFHAVFEYS